MNLQTPAYSANGARHPLAWPFIISFMGHLILFGIFLYNPQERSSGGFSPGIIDVQMVEMTGAPMAATASAKDDQKQLAEPKAEDPSEPEIAVKANQEAEVSVAPPKPKSKTALKYKTFKSEEVLKKTFERLEQKVDSAPPRPLEDTIKRLREQVAKEGRPEGTGAVTEGTAAGTKDGYGFGSKQEGEAIDIYRIEVAYTVNKNWAFAEQLASGREKASVVFKVMPDGRIEDIFFTDRSGNAHLDDSALKAIVKSSPVKPHPPGLNRPYIEVGLRFGPKGVQ